MRRYGLQTQTHSARWLVSYADFITLMFAFFVLMYAISSMDEGKYQETSATIVELFSNDPSSVRPIELEALPPGREPEMNIIEELQLPSLGQEQSSDDIYANETTFIEIRQKVADGYRQLIENKLLSVSGNEQWLEISLNSEIVFLPGTAVLTAESESLIYELSKILRFVRQPISVEGFTDDSPISSGRYPNNWFLSAARASAVASFLVESGLNPTQLSATGYGEFQPLVPNNSDENRQQNRRVSISVTNGDLSRISN